MKKDFKNRLEKALKSLEFSSGASLGSLVTEINRESPQLSLKKILEELQDGVDEGILSMDDGKFRVSLKREKAYGDYNACEDDVDGCSLIGNHSDGNVSIGDGKSVKTLDNLAAFKDRKVKKIASMNRKMKRKHREEGHRPKTGGTRLEKKCASQNKVDRESDSSDYDDSDLRKPSGKVEHKRRRGPRCTSMRKEVKMPSRVHIPWTPKPVPQRDLMHNDLLRKSPDPMIGPLFDPVSGAIDLPFS